MPQIKTELNNCSNQEGKNPQTGGGLGGARPVPGPGRAPLQRASPQPGTPATTTPGMHRGTLPAAASALAPRCMPGAVVLEAAGSSLRTRCRWRQPLLTGAGHHQQPEGGCPPAAAPPRQERQGDEQ